MRYETEEYLNQYLLFHYGRDEDQMPFSFGPKDLHFPVRYIQECLKFIPNPLNALEIGCAVGRASFELSNYCDVTAIDTSKSFIQAAKEIQEIGFKKYGDKIAERPKNSCSEKINFICSDVMEFLKEKVSFDLVIAANLLCRLSSPKEFLRQIGSILNPSGHLFLLSPYSWSEEFTSKDKWMTSNDVRNELNLSFKLFHSFEMPFLIRQHYRQYQWGVAEATLWKKN